MYVSANVREVYKSLTGRDGEKLVWDVSKRYMLHKQASRYEMTVLAH